MITRLKGLSQTLTFRIAALLALALLPIGLISVYQTYQLVQESELKDRANLMALTVEAADREIAYIRNAFGMADALAAVLPPLMRDTARCPARLGDLIQPGDGAITYVAYVSAAGTVLCGSDGAERDFAGTPLHRDMVLTPERNVSAKTRNGAGDDFVINVAVPVFDGARLEGYVTVSVPHEHLRPASSAPEGQRPLDLVTFNSDGEVLSTDDPDTNLRRKLPASIALSALTTGGKRSFPDKTSDGENRIFALTPIVDNAVFALGSWEQESRFTEGLSAAVPLLFPAFMWIAGLGVAFFAVENMVIRPTRNLRARMLVFMRTRRIAPRETGTSIPVELIEIDDTWRRMAESVLEDEIALQNSLHEKTVLLKEVHHRVKNNLQLIASILNMKSRKARSDAEKDTLRDLQQRVMSIARVHQKLYETSSQERVRADELISSIVQQIVTSGLSGHSEPVVRARYDPMTLYPDQAVPLSLAVSELVTNALKHMGGTESDARKLEITLRNIDDSNARLTIWNSVAPRGPDSPDTAGTGLGQKLIQAFAQQIDGHVTQTSIGDEYKVTLDFPLAGFQEAA